MKLRTLGVPLVSLLCAFTFVGLGALPTLQRVHQRCPAPPASAPPALSCRSIVSTDDLEQFQTQMDRNTYLQYARSVVTTRHFDYWGANIWPPAYPLLILADLKLFGRGLADAHYQVHMTWLAGTFWGLALLIWFMALRPLGPWRFAIGVVLLLPTFREWALDGGALSAESLSLVFFFGTLGLLTLGLRERRLGYFLAAGLLMAGSAYARGIFSALWEAVLLGLACCLLAHGALGLFAEHARRKGEPWRSWLPSFLRAQPREPYVRALLTLILMVGVMEASTFPWKHRNTSKGASFQMTTSGDIEFDQVMWSPTVPDFVVTGNTACLVDPAVCAAIAKSPELNTTKNKKRLAISTFLNRPGAWIRRKVVGLDMLWLGAPARSADAAVWAEQLAYAALYLGGLVLLALQARRSQASLLALLGGSLFLLANAAVFIMMHFEYRYSLPLKLFGFVLPWAALALERARRSHAGETLTARTAPTVSRAAA